MKPTVLLLLIAAAIPAAEDAGRLWSQKVQPFLAARCYECHGEKKAKNKLRLDTKEAILKGGAELGPAVVPGKPEESPLFKVCGKPAGEDMAMPPKGERPTKDEIAVIKAWIAGGAVFDVPVQKK
jgi:hypothetical protein